MVTKGCAVPSLPRGHSALAHLRSRPARDAWGAGFAAVTLKGGRDITGKATSGDSGQPRGPWGCHHPVSPSLTFGPGSPGCPVLPLKPWRKKRAGWGSQGAASRAQRVTLTLQCWSRATTRGSVSPETRGGTIPAQGTPVLAAGTCQALGRGDKEGCHSPEDPSSLVARGDQGHPGEKETRVGGVLGGGFRVAAPPTKTQESSGASPSALASRPCHPVLPSQQGPVGTR